MKKNKSAVLSLVLCVALVGSVSAAWTENWWSTWDGEGADNLWSTAGNWNTVPAGMAGEGTEIVPPSYNRGVQINGSATIGANGPVVNSDAGSLEAFYLGTVADSGGSPTFTMTDGGSLTAISTVLFGHNAAATPVLNIDGGTLTFEKNLNNSWGSPTINISGGILNCGGLRLANNGADNGANGSTLNMTGGTINTTYFDLNNGTQTRKIVVDLFGGTINASSTFGMDEDAHLDIRNDGTLIIAGDRVDLVNGFVTSGWITGYDVSSQVSVVLDGTNTVVTAIPEPTTITLLGLGGLALLRRKR